MMSTTQRRCARRCSMPAMPARTSPSSAPTRSTGTSGSPPRRSARTGSRSTTRSHGWIPTTASDNAATTQNWRDPPDPRPESVITGVFYECNPVSAPYVVYDPDNWIFAGTGVRKGTSFPGLVGPEYDRVNPAVPFPQPLQVLAHSPLRCDGRASYSDSAYYTVPSGAAVFASGTMRWVCGMRAPGLRPRGWNRRSRVRGPRHGEPAARIRGRSGRPRPPCDRQPGAGQAGAGERVRAPVSRRPLDRPTAFTGVHTNPVSM